MEFQTAELTLDDMENVSGGCPSCGAALAAAAQAAADHAAREAFLAALQHAAAAAGPRFIQGAPA